MRPYRTEKIHSSTLRSVTIRRFRLCTSMRAIGTTTKLRCTRAKSLLAHKLLTKTKLNKYKRRRNCRRSNVSLAENEGKNYFRKRKKK